MTASTKQKLTRNGTWKEFNKHAVLVSEGVYINNKKHGLWREYYDHTGTMMIEEMYHHDVPHGLFRSFHPNGQVWSEGQFVHGSREGFFSVYDENGRNIRTLLFVKNVLTEDKDMRKENEVLRKKSG